jgi:hypothetical protein
VINSDFDIQVETLKFDGLYIDMLCRSGSIIGLGLLTSHWTANDCKANFLRIFKEAFVSRNRRTFPRLKHSTCKYRPKPLEQSLRVAFTENQPLLGAGTDGRVGAFTKLAIPVVSTTSKMILFTNYIRQHPLKRRCFFLYTLLYPVTVFNNP